MTKNNNINQKCQNPTNNKSKYKFKCFDQQKNKGFIKPKKDFSFLLESEYVKRWIESYKEKHQQSRLSVLNDLCDFLGQTPDDLILKHHEDIKRAPLNKTNIGKKHLFAYYYYLQGENNNINDKISDKTVSKNSARQYVFSKLASYFKKNNVPISFEKGEIPNEDVRGTVDKTWRNGSKRVLIDEKKECLKLIKDSFANIRNKAIFQCKISSGMDDIDLYKLKIKDFNRGYFDNYNICYIDGNRQKVDIYFQTFFNSEACKMINLYFKDRERKGETLTEDSWLFVGNRKYQGIYTQIKSHIFSDGLKQACKKLGLKNITPKSFRRWFYSELKRNGIDTEVVERMMGHKIGVSEKYRELFADKTGEAFAKYYIEKIEHLTLLGNGTRKISEMDKKVEKLEIENEVLKESIRCMTNKMKNLIEIVKCNSKFIQTINNNSIRERLREKIPEIKLIHENKEKMDNFNKLTKKLSDMIT